MKKLSSGGGSFEPVSRYYQFEAPEVAHEKVFVIKKGKTLVGAFEHTFIEKGRYRKHLIATPNEGVVSIKGCTSLNKAFEGLTRGEKVKLTYKGLGEAKDGNNAPFLFDVFGLDEEEYAAEIEALPAAAKTVAKPVAKPVAKKSAPVIEADTDDEISQDDDGDQEVPF